MDGAGGPPVHVHRPAYHLRPEHGHPAESTHDQNQPGSLRHPGTQDSQGTGVWGQGRGETERLGFPENKAASRRLRGWDRGLKSTQSLLVALVGGCTGSCLDCPLLTWLIAGPEQDSSWDWGKGDITTNARGNSVAPWFGSINTRHLCKSVMSGRELGLALEFRTCLNQGL